MVGKSLQGWVKDTGPLESVACGRITVWLSTNNEIGERHLLRYLLLKHPLLVKSVLIIVGMTIIGSFGAPYIVHHFGWQGTVITLLGLLCIAFWLDRPRA